VLYDVETRNQIARDHFELLRAQAQNGRNGGRAARRWLSERLIAAGNRLAPDCTSGRRPARAV
jgi:hypothetical protein